jgi:hypothetical protein
VCASTLTAQPSESWHYLQFVEDEDVATYQPNNWEEDNDKRVHRMHDKLHLDAQPQAQVS